jgi:hypothetical protein
VKTPDQYVFMCYGQGWAPESLVTTSVIQAATFIIRYVGLMIAPGVVAENLLRWAEGTPPIEIMIARDDPADAWIKEGRGQ